MEEKRCLDVVMAFADKINSHDVDALCELMTDDHVFVDSLGSLIHGREEMHRAWKGYFKLFPDYKISFETIMERDNIAALFGTAFGTYAPEGQLREENKWEVPAAWRAVVKGHKIAEWRIYADNYKTVRMIRGL
jgi:ketosteroid isomerase-like protein